VTGGLWLCLVCLASGHGGHPAWREHHVRSHACPTCGGTGRVVPPLRDAQPPGPCPDCDARGPR